MRPDDPFDVDLPLVIAFSGGRTSGYMLRRFLDHFGRGVPAEVSVVFTNTGKERPETLDFVEAVAGHWNVPMTWLEYRRKDGKHGKHSYEEVDYFAASRDGRPFDEAIAARSFLPNRVARFCTAELKVKTMWRWAKDKGLAESGYTKAIGLRADEPERVSRLLNQSGDHRVTEHIVCPLATAGVTEADVMAFWKAQPFDLQLMPHEGNCDLCFLKRRSQLLEIMARRPDLAEWWAKQEDVGSGRIFRSRKDRPPYAALLKAAQQPRLFPLEQASPDEEEDLPCACTD